MNETKEMKTKYCGIYKVFSNGNWFVVLDNGDDYSFTTEPTEANIEKIRDEYVAANW